MFLEDGCGKRTSELYDEACSNPIVRFMDLQRQAILGDDSDVTPELRRFFVLVIIMCDTEFAARCTTQPHVMSKFLLFANSTFQKLCKGTVSKKAADATQSKKQKRSRSRSAASGTRQQPQQNTGFTRADVIVQSPSHFVHLCRRKYMML